jgi:hypothetical protein
LAYELNKPDCFPTEEREDFMLRQCVAAGGTDGAYAAQVVYVDGPLARTPRALVAMLREIMDNGLKTVYWGLEIGSALHVMLALRRNSRQVVVINKQLDGTNMIGKLLGERQRRAH